MGIPPFSFFIIREEKNGASLHDLVPCLYHRGAADGVTGVTKISFALANPAKIVKKNQKTGLFDRINRIDRIRSKTRTLQTFSR